MKKNNEEQDRDLEAAVNLIKHIRNFYEAIPPVMQQMCTEAILDAAGEMQKNGDLKPAMAELEYLPPSLHTGEIDLLLAKIYRQIGSFDNPDHPKFRKRAITIMQRHADEMKKDYDWNLFMGHLYALTFQDEKALPYLNQALKLYPKGGDTISKSDIREMIKGSKLNIKLLKMGEDIGDIGEYDFEDDPEEKPFTDLGSLTYEEIRKTYEGISAGLSAMPDPYSSDDSGSLDDDDEDYDDDDDLIDINDSFVKRAEDFWKVFKKNENAIIDAIEKGPVGTGEFPGLKAMENVRDASWELGFLPRINVGRSVNGKGKKYDLYLRLFGRPYILYAMKCIKDHAPKSVTKKWNIHVGRKIEKDGAIDDGTVHVPWNEINISVEEMQLPDNNTYYDITIDNKLENVVKNDAPDLAVDALMRAIGDYAFEENINSFSFQKLPEKGIRMTLADLPDFLRKEGKEIDVDPEEELMEARPYTREPDINDEDGWRGDIFAGTARCKELVTSYEFGEDGNLDDLLDLPVAPVFLCIPTKDIQEDLVPDTLFNVRETIEDLIGKNGTVMGVATGLHHIYIDLILWDIRKALEAIIPALQNSDLPEVILNPFSQNVDGFYIKEPRKAEPAKIIPFRKGKK